MLSLCPFSCHQACHAQIAAGVDSRDSRNICIELVAKWFHHMRVPILKNTAVKGEQSDGLVFLRLTLAPHWRRMILIERLFAARESRFIETVNRVCSRSPCLRPAANCSAEGRSGITCVPDCLEPHQMLNSRLAIFLESQSAKNALAVRESTSTHTNPSSVYTLCFHSEITIGGSIAAVKASANRRLSANLATMMNVLIRSSR